MVLEVNDIILTEGSNKLNIALTPKPEEPPPEEWPRHRLYVLVLRPPYYSPDDYANTATVIFTGVDPNGSYTKTASGYATKRGIRLYEGSIDVTATYSGYSAYAHVELYKDTHIELRLT